MPYKDPKKDREWHRKYERTYHRHRRDRREYFKEYRKRPLAKEKWKQRNHKRRGLGSIELNYPFEGSVEHHVQQNLIAHIPKQLHKPHHKIWTGEGMKEINAKVFEWLGIPDPNGYT